MLACITNACIITTINTTKEEPMNERKPSGPKPKLKNPRAVNLMLTDETIEKARTIGRGNVSAGVREAVDKHEENKK